MAYKITPNYFAIKLWDDSYGKEVKLHSISYDKCNFGCGFCNFKNRHPEEYRCYTEEEFNDIVVNLISQSRYFKFTGGEPTLNPMLINDVSIVKKNGGIVFLDSNGSNPTVIENLARKSLIDVLGISMKGITSDEALSTARIANRKLCWDNVFNTMDIMERYEIPMIVTMVLHNAVSVDNIYCFADFLEKYNYVRLKINNLLEVEFQDGHFEKTNELLLKNAVDRMISDRPRWKGRVTLVNSNDATTNNKAVLFL